MWLNQHQKTLKQFFEPLYISHKEGLVGERTNFVHTWDYWRQGPYNTHWGGSRGVVGVKEIYTWCSVLLLDTRITNGSLTTLPHSISPPSYLHPLLCSISIPLSVHPHSPLCSSPFPLSCFLIPIPLSYSFSISRLQWPFIPWVVLLTPILASPCFT